MKNSTVENLNSRLTPAAAKALEELVDDYKGQILITAGQFASSTAGEIDEISIRDVLESVNRIQNKRSTNLPKNIELVFRMYLVLGIITGLLGLAFFVYRTLDVRLTTEELLPLAFSLAGFLIAIFIYMYLKARQRRAVLQPESLALSRRRETDLSITYITKWQELELTVRKFVADRYGESVANKPIFSMISQLLSDKALSQEDESQIKKLLDTRNKIVHGGLNLNDSDYEISIRTINRLIGKLSN